MKKTVMIIMCAILIYSCDKGGSVLHEIENRTEYKGTVTLYHPHYSDSTYILKPNSKTQLFFGEGLGQTSYRIYIQDEDSVVFEFENADYIIYRKEDMDNGEKTIFKEEYWNIKEPSKRSFICTFPINEEDLQTHY